jgi:hypothetical protein
LPLSAAVILLLAMALVWWSFFALRTEQSVRVSFSSEEFSQRLEPLDNEGRATADRATGASFRIGADGYTVLLSDGSVVKLMPNAQLDIEDARSNNGNERFSTSLRLLAGELEAQVMRDDGVSRELSLFSNSVAIGVRGTVFSVIQDSAQARVMVTRGQVEAQGNVGATVLININEGTVVVMGAAIQQVVALPLPLPLPLAPLPTGAARSDADGMRFPWRSANVSASEQSSYQVEIGEDNAFERVFKRHIVNWQQGTLPPIERDGQYFWRGAGIDAQGLRGSYSDAFELQQDYYLRRSRASLAQGDLSAVRANLALADKALDEDIDRLCDKALLAISEQRFTSAVADLEMVLALRDSDAIARKGLAGAQSKCLISPLRGEILVSG